MQGIFKRSIRFVFIMMLLCIIVPQITAQSYEYYNGKRLYDSTELFEDDYFIDDDTLIHRIYYPTTDELIIEIRMHSTRWDEEVAEFTAYCAVMNFIEDHKHRYYNYTIQKRETFFNKNKSVYNLRVIKYKLKN